MRLIDADMENERLSDFITQNDSEIQYAIEHKDRTLLEQIVSEHFDRQPTAYDLDKVVEQMEELREEILSGTEYDNDTVNYYLEYADSMIEIVKSGGISKE